MWTKRLSVHRYPARIWGATVCLTLAALLAGCQFNPPIEDFANGVKILDYDISVGPGEPVGSHLYLGVRLFFPSLPAANEPSYAVCDVTMDGITVKIHPECLWGRRARIVSFGYELKKPGAAFSADTFTIQFGAKGGCRVVFGPCAQVTFSTLTATGVQAKLKAAIAAYEEKKKTKAP